MSSRLPLFVVLVMASALLVPRQASADAQEPRQPLRPERTAPPLPRLERSVEARAEADDQTLLVHLRRGASVAEASDVARAASGRHHKRLAHLGVEVVSTEGRTASEVAARLRSDPRVERVERNRVRFASYDPDDPLLWAQANVFNSRLPAAWDVTRGNATIDIAVLDTGVDLDHPDLAARIGAKRDVVNNDMIPQDDNGHGTFVAGISAADSDNAIGIAGAAVARIMPVKVLDSDGSGNDADIADGIVWATNNGAEIINMSFGGPGSTQTLANAVAYALSNGVVLVAAAGNEGSTEPSFPAAYAGVITVGATDEFGDVVGFSNRGPHVDVVAQGLNVVSTMLEFLPGPVDDYGIGSGTSFAAPLVSGVAALMLARNPTFTPSQVLSRFRARSIDRGPRGIDDHYGWGLVDAYGAVGGRAAASPPQAVRDENEPDDDAVDAGEIGSPSRGTIAPEGDVDWLYEDISGAGTLSIHVRPPEGTSATSLDPEIGAFSPAMESIDVSKQTLFDGTRIFTVPAAGPGRYRFRLGNAASSRSPGPLSRPASYEVSSVFAAGPVPPDVGDRLWVSDIEPDAFAEGVPASTQPKVTFAREPDPSSVTANTVRLVDAKTNAAVPATLSHGSGSVTISPAQALVSGRTYVVKVGGVSDAAGEMQETHTSRFTVTAPPAPLDLEADFNGDGYEDTVIAAPNEGLGSKAKAGVVHVLYGSPGGAKASGSQIWHQNSKGIAGVAEPGDRFGFAVATGDLNADGFDDLIVGVPFEDIGSKRDAGMIHVILGSPSGLTATGSQIWHQDSKRVPGGAEAGDRFGAALATGRFDLAKGDDVAIGVPGEGIGKAAGAGAVHIMRGGAGGLVTTATQLWTQNSPGIRLPVEPGDNFGAALAAGDFHGDGNDDLAIGAPFDNVFDGNEGSVTIMRGSIVGLRPAGVLVNVLNGEEPKPGDLFGFSLAIADVGGYSPADGYAELIVGIPGSAASMGPNVGRADVVFSDHSDPWLDVQQVTMAGPKANSVFAASMSARAFGDRGVLVGGAPHGSVDGLAHAGSVHVFESGAFLASGLVGLGAPKVLHQNSPGVPGGSEAGDRFGWDVSLLDVDGDRRADLVVGVPFEAVGSKKDAGAAHVIRGVAEPSIISASLLTQNTPGIHGAVEPGDTFGAALS